MKVILPKTLSSKLSKKIESWPSFAYEETLYIDVNAWGYQAAYCKNVEFAKGDRVSVRGRIQDRSWTDTEGNKRFSMVVVPSNISKIVRPPRTEKFDTAKTAKAGMSETAEVTEVF